MKRIDPNKTLDGHRLKLALESIYCTFVSGLVANGAADEPKLYQHVIPAMVFDAAVGAGWLEFAPEDATSPIREADWKPTAKTVLSKTALDDAGKRKPLSEKTKPSPTAGRGRDPVLLADFVVDRVYADSFLALLKDVIGLHLGEGTKLEEHLKSLPQHTSRQERQDLLTQYVENQRRLGISMSMKKVAELAEVDFSILTKWKNGKLADSTEPARRIAVRLRYGQRMGKRRYSRDPKPE
ncbi:MAG: hypothetical protein LC114_04230 [Bryobacterales bacterium]|nr:hypothetical protein [Bryobacterales bacterium]